MKIQEYKGLIERYRKYLPVTNKTPVISLHEGNTPLIPVPRVADALGRKKVQVYLKYEGLNPTGSFKDRGMTMAVSKAVEEGQKAVICASTGNTSASASAYAARAGIKSIVLIPEGAIALGKLAQALIHGAQVIPVNGNFDDALELVIAMSEQYPVQLVNSINPYRIEGQKTAAFEICDTLGAAPDIHCLPVGNAGNITAYWKGYCEYRSIGQVSNQPLMWGFQASGSAPIVLGRAIKNPKTIATAIRIGNPASWKQAEAARDESGGCIDKVTDRQILKAYAFLTRHEGLFVEPASAASVAGLFIMAESGCLKKFPPSKELTIVCTVTGHGLKDPKTAIDNVKAPKVYPKDLKKVAKAAGLVS
jgi:threonine synthase